jgi:hypothetical protein
MRRRVRRRALDDAKAQAAQVDHAMKMEHGQQSHAVSMQHMAEQARMKAATKPKAAN